MEINFNVDGQNIIRTDEKVVASGAVQSLTARFFTNDDWDELTVFARFSGNKGVYDMKLDAANVCKVPWEVIEHPYFEVNLIGTSDNSINGTEAVIFTTKKCMVKVYDSLDVYDFEPLPDSPAIIEQYEALIRHADEVAERLLEWAAEGRFDGRDGTCVHTTITPGSYAFNINYETGMLVLVYEEGTTPPDFEIDDNGHLIYTIGD